MKTVTLFFASVVLLTFAKVGAMNNGSRAGRGRGGTARQNPRPEVGAMNNEGKAGRGRGSTARQNPRPEVGAVNNDSGAYHGRGGTARQNLHPDIGPWTSHLHTHPTRILYPVPGHPGRARREIRIVKVVNGRLVNYHLLQGELVPDLDIASCHSPHGYAIVELNGGERLYACLKPISTHQESVSREHAGDPPVYLTIVFQEGKPRLDADLAPRDERSAFESRRLLFHDSIFRTIFGVGPYGRVRYVQPNATEVEGELYKYTGILPGP